MGISGTKKNSQIIYIHNIMFRRGFFACLLRRVWVRRKMELRKVAKAKLERIGEVVACKRA